MTFASHLIGPVAQVGHDDPLALVNHERRLALAQGTLAPGPTPWGPRRAKRRMVVVASARRSLLGRLASSIVGIRRLSA